MNHDENQNQNQNDDEFFENNFSENDFSNIENETHSWSVLNMTLNCLIQSKKKDVDANMIWIINRSEYFFICGFILIDSNSKSRTAFFIRFVCRFSVIDFTSFDVMKSCIRNLKIQFESLIFKQSYQNVIRLFY